MWRDLHTKGMISVSGGEKMSGIFEVKMRYLLDWLWEGRCGRGQPQADGMVS